jgi:hypothetical protein
MKFIQSIIIFITIIQYAVSTNTALKYRRLFFDLHNNTVQLLTHNVIKPLPDHPFVEFPEYETSNLNNTEDKQPNKKELTSYYTNSTDQIQFEPVYTLGFLSHHSSFCPISIRNAYIVKVSFWSNVLNKSTFPAFKCSRFEEIWNRKYHETKPVQWNVQTKESTLSYEACEYMAKYHTSPSQQPLFQINATHFNTNDKMQLNHSMLYASTNWNHTILNYHLQFINISVNQNSGLIESLDAPAMEICTFSDHVCHDNNKTVIWNVQSNNTCLFQEHIDNQCFLTESRLTCPSIGITVSEHEEVLSPKCGTDLGVIRARLTNFSPFQMDNPINQRLFYNIDTNFATLYNDVNENQQQQIQLFHIAHCGSIPKRIDEPRFFKDMPLPDENEVERINPNILVQQKSQSISPIR